MRGRDRPEDQGEPTVKRQAAILAAILLVPIVVRAQGAAAVVEFSGKVSIETAAGEQRALSGVAGARVGNGTLASGDTVVTAPGAAVAVRLADGGSFRIGPASRVAVVETVLGAKPRLVRRAIRLDSGTLRFDLPSRSGVFHQIDTPAGRLTIFGAQGSVAWTGGRLTAAIEGGRAALADAAGRIRVPLGVGQSVELKPDAGTGAVTLSVRSDGRRIIRAVLGVVRVELTAGDAVRMTPDAENPEGPATVAVLSGPVAVARGETAPLRTVDTGTRFKAEVERTEAPAEKVASNPAPATPTPPMNPDPDPVMPRRGDRRARIRGRGDAGPSAPPNPHYPGDGRGQSDGLTGGRQIPYRNPFMTVPDGVKKQGTPGPGNSRCNLWMKTGRHAVHLI
jgi:ferric-dicitrate binding protein FerR (iron transport regulator)